ncbi:hypothetical protein [Herbiconiux sp.]|uniref:hypothetical protein n=1 Tax=Herbiconiux sp. TaxID=1871186 RepID=UPI0025C5AD96|nr:hypothetical protein [Herbiconiux sp.]
MPPPRAACGTYGAYRRHLKHGEKVDAACRAAQKEHDGGRSTSAPARAARAAAKKPPADETPPAPPTPTPTTADGHVSRVEVLKEMLEDSRTLVKALMKTDPARAYLQQREQREIIREIAELQGNGQVKGVTLADQLAEVRARRLAATAAS